MPLSTNSPSTRRPSSRHPRALLLLSVGTILQLYSTDQRGNYRGLFLRGVAGDDTIASAGTDSAIAAAEPSPGAIPNADFIRDVIDHGQHQMQGSVHRQLAAGSCYDDTPHTCDAKTNNNGCWDTKTCCMAAYWNIYDKTPVMSDWDDPSDGIGCTANSLEFLAVTGFQVFDPGAEYCNCDASNSPVACSNPLAADEVSCDTGDTELGDSGKLPLGTAFGACRGSDDNVQVEFTVNVDVKNAEFDVGLYINTDGGNADWGNQCIIAGMTPYTTSSNVEIVAYDDEYQYAQNNNQYPAQYDDDECYDFVNSGLLTDYPFQRMTLSCTDTGGDGLLDFHVAASFSNKKSTTPDCSYTGDGTVLKFPHPSQSSKCWSGQRIQLNIYVPPPSTPSVQPSTSIAPSMNPSISVAPSLYPSDIPSEYPSMLPSEQPSISIKPSQYPSQVPSTSTEPSSMPSEQPSTSSKPSDVPSLVPSTSSNPSESPSLVPSTSSQPSDVPSLVPSISILPSESPSLEPSISTQPTDGPSENPSTSSAPSTSQHPSSNTRWPSNAPSDVPSISPTANPTAFPSESPTTTQKPSVSPTMAPSISKKPSLSPTYAPSDAPSDPPTGSLYYPDWENEEQICVNDGADPTYMKKIQRDNYLYRSKEECCETHFWWRVAQCMQNEHPLYFSDGEKCDQTVNLDQWEVKYTPQVWDSSDLFETLEECCNAKFWWDVPGCIAASPKEIVFTVTFEARKLIEPTTCQDADIMANAVGVSMEKGLNGGSANVTTIGCATLSKNPDTSNPECGGCISGSFEGDWDGTRPEGYYTYEEAQVTQFTVEVSTLCDAGNCADSASLQTMYESVHDSFKSFLETGQFEAEIIRWANAREPNVPELYFVEIVNTSFYTDGTFTNPLNDPEDTVEAVTVTTTGKLTVPNLNQDVEVVKVTTTGSFSVGSMGTSTLDPSQEEVVVGYFEDAIAESLGSNLPEGSTVTVTSIENGVVQYEIATYADSSTEANTAITQIKSLLSSGTTMGLIASSVSTSVSTSTDTDIASDVGSITIASNSAGSTSIPTTTSQVTVQGTFAVTNLNPSSMTTTQKEEAKDYFETALTQELEDQGLLPEGATVVVTGLNNDGSVQYEIRLYGTSSEQSNTAITQIESSLSQESTLDSIATKVVAESTATSSTINLSTIDVTGNTQIGTTGLTMTTAEEEATKATFEAAITESLGTDLPDGATITVTSIENGVVSYEITMSADSSEDATAAVSAINTSLSDTTKLSTITSNVAAASSTTTVTTSGELTVPNLNQEVEVFGVTTTGSFSASNLDTSSFDAPQTAEATGYFEDAITEQLGLPAGSTVTVTSISGGTIEYEVFTFASTDSAASTAASSIQSTLDSASAAITTSVQADASASSDTTISTAMASTSVSGNTAGATSTPATTSQVTVEGKFTVDNLSFDPNQQDEVMEYFESAITQQLGGQGLLPAGASVTVTGLNTDGSVQYQIDFFDDNTAASSTAISSIDSALSQPSTLTSISSTVQTESANSSVDLSSVVVTGNTQVSTTGIAMTAAEEEEARTYFEAAITSSLGSDLPEGAIVTVTGIEDGAVSYFITMDVESSADGTTAVNSINSSLGGSSTLAEITSLVATASSGSSSSTLANAMSGASVDSLTVGANTESTSVMNSLSGASVASFTAGTTSETTVAKVTMEGQLTTSLSGLSSTEVTEATEYFEDAIAATLQAEGSLPKDAFVTVTGIDANGVVSYKITLNLSVGADNAALVNSITSSLSSSSTLEDISVAVAAEAALASSAIGALSTILVTGNIPGDTRGVSFKQWYPNWLTFGRFCENDGNQPVFMKESDSQGDYLFSTQKECCDVWYSFSEECVGSSGDPSGVKFFPQYTNGYCNKKDAKDFDSFEFKKFDTLEECCAKEFNYNKQKCCDSPGMGGCGTSGKVVYMPDWSNNKCHKRSEETLANHEVDFAKGSLSECCTHYFDWYGSTCLRESSS